MFEAIPMQAFARLMDRLSLEYSRDAKLCLLTDYFLTTPDPARGYALGALIGTLSFKAAKPALLKSLVMARVDPVYFALSYDYVGDLSETIALLWPNTGQGTGQDQAQDQAQHQAKSLAEPPDLATVVETLQHAARFEVEARLPLWLDGLDVTGRWALLKLMTGGLRIGVSARLAMRALSDFASAFAMQRQVASQALPPQNAPDLGDMESLLHSEQPPYLELFAWLEGRAARPRAKYGQMFYAPMLASSFEARDMETLNPQDFLAEWKWDGVRVLISRQDADDAHAPPTLALFSRAGENMLPAFPDVAGLFLDAAFGTCVLDGELLVRINGEIASFQDLQQRLNRKSAPPKLIKAYPIHVRLYDALVLAGADIRTLPFAVRRARLEAFVSGVCAAMAPARDLLGLARAPSPHAASFDVSQLVPFATFDDLDRLRTMPGESVAPCDARAVEGVMLKHRASPYLAGRARGHWFKWKRDPYCVDAVLMYAQRGHGKRSSYYSDYTFGVWLEDAPLAPQTLVPVGKAYFGFTDEELKTLDHYVRANTKSQFGPVREVVATPQQGLVLEIAFEGLAYSPRHKSGIAMRFPRIARVRFDKPSREADRLFALRRLARTRMPQDKALKEDMSSGQARFEDFFATM